MNTSEEIKNELEQLAPRLAKMEKVNPFSVPENYFEGLSQSIKEKIALQKKKAFDWSGLVAQVFQPRHSVVLAALIIALVFGISRFSRESKIETAFSKISADDLQKYIQENIDDFDENISGAYCCLDLNSNDYLFDSVQEQDTFIENYFINHLNTEDIL